MDEANVLKECFETPPPSPLRGIANNKEKHAAKFLPPDFRVFPIFSLSLFLFSFLMVMVVIIRSRTR